jgi:hypothetical protein
VYVLERGSWNANAGCDGTRKKIYKKQLEPVFNVFDRKPPTGEVGEWISEVKEILQWDDTKKSFIADPKVIFVAVDAQMHFKTHTHSWYAAP